MKSLLLTSLLAVASATVFPIDAFAAAHPVLYARNADSQSLFEEPYIRIVNEGDEPLDLAGYSIHYYIYEAGKNASELAVQYWYTGEYGYSSQVEIQDLDEILVPGDGPGANMVIVMTLGGGAMLQPGQYVTVQNGIHAINWSSFNETDDWSHIASTVFVEAVNIVLKDATGIVVSGVAPTGTGSGGTTTISGVPLFWLGEHWSYELVFSTSNYEPQDGDAYQNLGDGKVYVYFNGEWNPMEGFQSSIRLVDANSSQSDSWYLENNDEVFEIIHFNFGMPGERRTLFSIDNQTAGVRLGNNFNAAVGTNSLTINGPFVEAPGKQAFAGGYQSQASGDQSIAFGYWVNAIGDNSAAIGYSVSAIADSSMALGSSIDVSGYGSVGFGLDPGFPDFECESAHSLCIMGGNVGIGTGTPDELLTVDGMIKSEGITVDGMIISEGIQVVVEVADYVFKEGYPLMELDELAQFIEHHGHLPKIKSEEEVRAEGGTVSLGESYTLLLEKIEELTLYTIAQQKEIDELKHLVGKGR